MAVRIWSAGGRSTLKNGKQLTIIEHPESYEVRRRGATTYFYFEDEPASRNSTGRMTRKQAEQAAVYIQKLPEAEQLLEEWQATVEALLLVVEHDGARRPGVKLGHDG